MAAVHAGALSLKSSPEQLDRARREWLAGLAARHAVEASAESALALARGAWMCGDYDDALAHFVAARDLRPEAAEVHLALVRAASALALQDLESQALDAALAVHAMQPELRLHAALRLVPADLAAAREWLRPALAHPPCAMFDAALAAISGGPTPSPAAGADPRDVARFDALRWVLSHSSAPAVHAGLPIAVLLRALEAAPRDGLTLECGVYFGRSLRVIAARTRGVVHGFDSFQGLPEAWSEREGAGAYSTAGRLPRVPGEVTLHAGWFEDTLPPFLASNPGPIRLLHIDCDIYSSTRTVLEHAAPRLVPGSVIVFDDFLGYPGYEAHELRAFEEFAGRSGIGWEPVAACLMGREVAIRIIAA